MNLTRDSLSLWVAFGVVLVAYLITNGTPPTQWSYMEWLNAASVVLAWASGKLATSPLPGAK